MALLSTAPNRASIGTLLPLLGLGTVCVVWSYWVTLTDMSGRWAHDPQYSHGYLVPLFALVLLWLRRQQKPTELRPSWWGAPLLALGILMRMGGDYYFSPWLDAMSLLPTMAGVWMMIGGIGAWRWSWPAIGFLIFMIPLPYRFSGELAGPLQRFATIVSTFLLQTVGVPALAEGNVILLTEVEIGVVEACSGLRMMVIFFALSTAVALLLRRPLWERAVVVLSAVPIALACNVIRITGTGLLHELVSSEVANAVFHDLAGWLMMPMALAMLWVELQLLQRLLIEPVRPSSARIEPPGAPRRRGMTTGASMPRPVTRLRPRPAT